MSFKKKFPLIFKIFAIALAMALLASCGSSAEDKADGGSTSSTDSAKTKSDDPDRPTSLEDPKLQSSSLATFLGASSDADQQAAMLERQREMEREVATCMTGEGFEYTPREIKEESYYGGGSSGLKYWSDEWVETYGLGVSTQRFGQSQVGPNLVGYDDEAHYESASEPDPQDEYVSSLSQTEREAYMAALHGDMSQNTDGMMMPQGCWGEAMSATMGNFMELGNEFFEEFGSLFQDLDERYNADPRLVKWRKEISTCMSGKGHAFTDLDALREQINARLSPIEPGGSIQYPEGFDDMSPREQEDFWRESNKIPADQLEILAEIQAEELELAQVLVGCGGGELNEAIFSLPIRQEIEEEFLEANSEQLAKYEGLFGN